MQLAMMQPADWDRELVAYSASQCTRLRKSEVMRIRRHAAAHKARLPQNELAVVFIAQANRFAQSMHHVLSGLLFGPLRNFAARKRVRRARGRSPLVRDGMKRRSRGKSRRLTERLFLSRLVTIQAIAERGEPRLKPLLDKFGVCCCQGVLGRQIPMRPGGRLIGRIYSRQLLNQAFAKTCR